VFYLWDFGVKETRDPLFQISFRWDTDLLSGYDYEFAPNVATRPGAEHFRGFDNPDLTARLAAWHPEAILIFGYNWLSHLRVIAWARLHRIPLIFRGDSHLLGRLSLPWHRRVLLRLLYRQFSSVLYVGAANRDYFTALGISDRRLFHAPHSVDDRLYDSGDPVHIAAAAALRARLGIAPSTRVVLFAGKLTASKQPRELLAAFLALSPHDTALVIAGEGEEKPALIELARNAPPGTVHILPFANQSEMPAHYLLADLFVLPSRGHYETWGLAVNEAMHMGTPALVSDLVGCQRDLVKPGETGWVFDATERGSLERALAEALATLANPASCERIHRAVATLIARYTYAQTAAGLLAALRLLPLRAP
jgi:glycosyltransferase involved in cell wall biosynthesis